MFNSFKGDGLCLRVVSELESLGGLVACEFLELLCEFLERYFRGGFQDLVGGGG